MYILPHEDPAQNDVRSSELVTGTRSSQSEFGDLLQDLEPQPHLHREHLKPDTLYM